MIAKTIEQLGVSEVFLVYFFVYDLFILSFSIIIFFIGHIFFYMLKADKNIVTPIIN